MMTDPVPMDDLLPLNQQPQSVYDKIRRSRTNCPSRTSSRRGGYELEPRPPVRFSLNDHSSHGVAHGRREPAVSELWLKFVHIAEVCECVGGFSENSLNTGIKTRDASGEDRGPLYVGVMELFHSQPRTFRN